MKMIDKSFHRSVSFGSLLVSGLVVALFLPPVAQGGERLGDVPLPGVAGAQRALSAVVGEGGSTPATWSVSPYAASRLTTPLASSTDGVLPLTRPDQDGGPPREVAGYSVGVNLTTAPTQGPWSVNGRVAYSVTPDRGDARDRVAENVFRHVSSTLATGYTFHDWEPYLSFTLDKRVSFDESGTVGATPPGSTNTNMSLGARFDLSGALSGEVVTSRSLQMHNQVEERNILGNLRLAF
ncbi:MAG: hypothetical protein HQL66_03980 [Magnetococcales bacterium]|nr:hypothetical protein [Magnetococcales bacterium]